MKNRRSEKPMFPTSISREAGQTSGSDTEMEQWLLKGDVPTERSSLLDLFSQTSWIKKSNFEGLFNGLFFVCFMVLTHYPIVNYSLHGRFIEPTYLTLAFSRAPGLTARWLCIESFAFLALFIQKMIMWFPRAETALVWTQFAFEIALFGLGYAMIQQLNRQGGWVTDNLFVITNCQLIFYKMHSYALTNSESR